MAGVRCERAGTGAGGSGVGVPRAVSDRGGLVAGERQAAVAESDVLAERGEDGGWLVWLGGGERKGGGVALYSGLGGELGLGFGGIFWWRV